MRQVKFIYNPYSGEVDIVKKLDLIIQIYKQYGYNISLYIINYSQNLEYAFNEGLNVFDHILIAGGYGL